MSVVQFIWNALVFAGVVGGLISPVVLLYDRLWRKRPLAYLDPRDGGVSLVLKNVSDETLLVDSIGAYPDSMVSVAMGHGLKYLVGAAAAPYYPSPPEGDSRRTFCVLKPTEERAFPLVRLKALEAAQPGEALKIRVEWRTTRSAWPIKRAVTVSTTASDLAALKTQQR